MRHDECDIVDGSWFGQNNKVSVYIVMIAEMNNSNRASKV